MVTHLELLLIASLLAAPLGPGSALALLPDALTSTMTFPVRLDAIRR
jgi:hypothetical protein